MAMESCEVPFTVLAQNGAVAPRPCLVYQEIRFNAPVLIHHIKFRNFYCASLSIMQLLSPIANENSDSSEYKWIPILCSYKLMENPHFEDDAQYFHTISSNRFNENFNPVVPIYALRLCLEQPSPNWSSFGLRNLRCLTLRRIEKEQHGEPLNDQPVYDIELKNRVNDAMLSVAEIKQTLRNLQDNINR